MGIIYLVTSILAGAFGQVFFKLGIGKVGAEGMAFYIALAKNFWIYLGAISYGISFMLWMKVLQFYELSFARPLTGAGYIVTFLFAILILGEQFTPRRILATVIITIGVILMK